VRRHQHHLGPLALRHLLHELPDEIEAREVGHHVVDDDRVERPLGQEALRGEPAGGFGDVVALLCMQDYRTYLKRVTDELVEPCPVYDDLPADG